MASLKTFLYKHRTVLFCLALFIITASLRFPYLDYSDYHGDEFKAFIMPHTGESVWQFLLNQRKGPMQYIISYLPYIFTQDFTNEFAQRLPFSIASCLATVVFFLFVKRVTNSTSAAFAAGYLFLTNGYITGFGRIAQYQNLNLLFSFSALLAYSYTTLKGEGRYSLIGTFFWCLSILSHWDAVLIFPIVVLLTYNTLLKDKKLLIQNILLGTLLLTPFMIPYLLNLQGNEGNQLYLFKRMGLDIGYSKISLYKSLTELYNPYVVLQFLTGMALIGVMDYKKTSKIALWFVIVFLTFEIIVKNPGTHIYNFLLPIFVLSGAGIGFLLRVNKYLNILLIPILLWLFSFLYIQTYAIYIDHSREYPYESKTLSFMGNQFVLSGIQDIKPAYMRGSYIPLFGFPHNRYWKEINIFVNAENVKNNENLKFITNEDKAFCDSYMDIQYGMGKSFYAIGIKRPVNYVSDFSFSNFGSKNLVHKMNLNEETVVKIFKVDGKRDI